MKESNVAYMVFLNNNGFLKAARVINKEEEKEELKKLNSEGWIEVEQKIFNLLLTGSVRYNRETNSLHFVSTSEQWSWEEAEQNFLSSFKKIIRGIVWRYFPPHKQNNCALGLEDRKYCQHLQKVIAKAREITNILEKIYKDWNGTNTEAERLWRAKAIEFEQWMKDYAFKHNLREFGEPKF